MSHANATLTVRHRLKVAQLIVDQGYPISEVAAKFQVSWPTVKPWADRYAAGEPVTDRSSRPVRQPGRTPAVVVRRVLELRWRKRLGPVQLSARTGVAASTVHKILVRKRLNCVDRPPVNPSDAMSLEQTPERESVGGGHPLPVGAGDSQVVLGLREGDGDDRGGPA